VSVTEGAGKVPISEDHTLYHLMCGCGDPGCTLVMEVDYDHEIRTTSVSFYGELYSLPESWWDRIRMVFALLFRGQVKAKFDLVVMEPSHLYGIIGALLEARRQMVDAGKPIRRRNTVSNSRLRKGEVKHGNV